MSIEACRRSARSTQSGSGNRRQEPSPDRAAARHGASGFVHSIIDSAALTLHQLAARAKSRPSAVGNHDEVEQVMRTTGLSSWPRHFKNGSPPLAPRRPTSNPVALGRTATSRASMHACGTNCSTARSSTPCEKPRSSGELAPSLQRRPTPRFHRLQATGTGGLHALRHRMAGYTNLAGVISSAKPSLRLDYPMWAAQRPLAAYRYGAGAWPDHSISRHHASAPVADNYASWFPGRWICLITRRQKQPGDRISQNCLFFSLITGNSDVGRGWLFAAGATTVLSAPRNPAPAAPPLP
jgi:hypothetical protein